MSYDQVATERVVFQYNSALTRRVVAACQAYLDWADTTRPMVSDKIAIATPARILAAAKYARNIFAPELVKISVEELNLIVKPIIERDELVFGNGAMVPVFQTIADAKDWDKYITTQAGFSGTTHYTPNKVDAHFFASLSKTVDLTTSRLTGRSKEYFIYLLIYPTCFLGPEIYSTAIQLTAEEQAAIILHELGHGMTILEHIGDIYHRVDIVTNSIRYLSTTADLNTLKTAAGAIQDQITDEPEQKALMTRVVETFSTTVTQKMALVVGTILIIPILIIFSCLMTSFLSDRVDQDENKTSDQIVTISNHAYIERIADEFVSRHGLGGSLVSAFSKIDGNESQHDTLKNGHYCSPVMDILHSNSVTKMIMVALSILNDRFSLMLSVTDKAYDPLWLRLEHLLLNNMVVFKDTQMSEATRRYFLNDTKAMIECLDAYKKSKSVKLYQLFWGTLTRIVSRNSMLDAFSTANLSADYDVLQVMTNGLIKNRLAYHAARLQSL